MMIKQEDFVQISIILIYPVLFGSLLVAILDAVADVRATTP